MLPVPRSPSRRRAAHGRTKNGVKLSPFRTWVEFWARAGGLIGMRYIRRKTRRFRR